MPYHLFETAVCQKKIVLQKEGDVKGNYLYERNTRDKRGKG